MTNYWPIDDILMNRKEVDGEMIEGEYYMDMNQYADLYLQQYQQYSFIIICNLFNLSNALRIFRVVDWFQIMLENTLYVLAMFLIMLIPLQLGFGFFTVVQIGPYIPQYKSLLGSLQVQIITMMGQQDSMSLMRNHFWFTIIWTMLFIIFFAYFFITASIVAFEDGFDEAIKIRGYPNDFSVASQWHADQYLKWALDWLPEKLKRKDPFVQIFNLREEVSDSEEEI